MFSFQRNKHEHKKKRREKGERERERERQKKKKRKALFSFLFLGEKNGPDLVVHGPCFYGPLETFFSLSNFSNALEWMFVHFYVFLLSFCVEFVGIGGGL